MSSSPPPSDSPPSDSPPSDSPPSSPTPPPSSPPPSSPPPSSPPPSSPPPSSPPPSSPPPSSPPPSSPPPSSPPPSSPPPNSSSSSPPPPQDSSNSSPPPPSDSQSSPPPPPPTPSPPPSPSYNSGNGEFRPPPPPPPPQSSNDSPSPPPPPRSLSLSSKSSPNSPSSSGSSNSSNVGVIAGVAVGVALVLAVLIAILVACVRKKKKRQQPTSSSYFADSGPQGGQYYNHTPSEHNNNWQSGPKTSDHIVGMSSGTPGGAGWPMPPPPPPPHMCSSDLSSNFSGPHGPPLPPPPLPASMAFNKNTFTYDELVAATSGFAQSNLLGQGGFGYVHKGVLPNGKEIAVKSLKSGSGQGDREFQAEVEIISRVHHRHLVSLVGYCIAGGRKLLVYEFLPNNNLEVHLHAKDRPAMDWSSRFKIAMGSAKGLAYLHEDCHPRIIHRDIKTSNILLDFNFEPKVSDFGLAKLSQDNNTHVSTRVMGTFGYLAPEYASSGKLTDKSDVFSFGVVLLELITGRRPVDTTGDYMEDSLVDWARPICMHALEDGNYDRDHLVDIRLDGDYDKQEMARMVACASASIRHSARRRPKMSQIVRALEGDVSLEDLNEGVKPGQSSYFGGGGSSNTSSDYDASSYSADMKKFRKLALDSQNYGSSEYGATSEYGLNPSSSSESSGEISRKGTRLHNNNA